MFKGKGSRLLWLALANKEEETIQEEIGLKDVLNAIKKDILHDNALTKEEIMVIFHKEEVEVKVEVEVEADSLMIEDIIKVMTEEETILDRNLDQNRIHHQQEKLKRIQDLDLQADLQ